MDRTYRQLWRHAGIFGAGTLLFRITSIALLPIYTHYLAPADYGVLALVDLTVNLLAIVSGAGIASAATRAHFEGDDGEDRDRTWWTAFLLEMGIAFVVCVPGLLERDRFARVLFGSEVERGASYVALALATLWVGAVAGVLDAFFRAEKESTFVVRVGVVKLLVNSSLNVALLIHWRMGVGGVLWGNLASALVAFAIQFHRFVAARRRVHFSPSLARSYWRFGWPLVVFGLCSSAMHEADRFILRAFVSLHDLGLYSLAYQIGQSVNTLVTVPFTSIWSVMVYEVAKRPNAGTVYARVFRDFTFGLSLTLLAASLFAPLLLRIIAPAEYERATHIVPVVCLAYVLFSAHDHFKVPALLASRTVALLPAVIVAAAFNIVLNLFVDPIAGAMGAAWVSVVTFAVFAGVGLVRNRRIDRYPYPLLTCGAVILAMVASYLMHRALGDTNAAVTATRAIAICLAWALVLYVGWRREEATRSSTERATEMQRRPDNAWY